jgi:hypothetical protein
VDAWDADPASWNREVLGPWPGEAGSLVPLGVAFHYNEKRRKRKERRRDAEAAAARRAAADVELRDKLIAAAGDNVVRGPALDDVSPIRVAMELVPVDIIMLSIRHGHHRLMCPVSEPVKSLRDERLLKRIALAYCEDIIIPSLVAGWSKAAPGKAADASEPSPATPSAPEAGSRTSGAPADARCRS